MSGFNNDAQQILYNFAVWRVGCVNNGAKFQNIGKYLT